MFDGLTQIPDGIFFEEKVQVDEILGRGALAEGKEFVHGDIPDTVDGKTIECVDRFNVFEVIEDKVNFKKSVSRERKVVAQALMNFGEC